MHPVFDPVAPYRYLLPNLYLSVADIPNPDLFVCGSQTWISLDIVRFYEEHCQPAGPYATDLHWVCLTAVTVPPRVSCVVCSVPRLLDREEKLLRCNSIQTIAGTDWVENSN